MSTLVVVALVANSNVTVAAELCVDLGDPAGNFVPRGYCHPTDPGDVGGAVNIQLEDLAFTVLDDPDGRLDIIVPMEHSITANASAPIHYTTSLMWPASPVSRESIRVRELGINFKPAPTTPRGVGLTNVPAGEDPPESFTWVVDPNDAANVIGWTVEQQLDDMPSDMGGSITHYHMTTWDLPVGTEVTFSKSVTGGVVVPELSTWAMVLIAICVVGLFARGRQRRLC